MVTMGRRRPSRTLYSALGGIDGGRSQDRSAADARDGHRPLHAGRREHPSLRALRIFSRTRLCPPWNVRLSLSR